MSIPTSNNTQDSNNQSNFVNQHRTSPRPNEGGELPRPIRQRVHPNSSSSYVSQSMPTMDHRTPEFQGLYSQLQELLQQEPHLADVADVGGGAHILQQRNSGPPRYQQQYQEQDDGDMMQMHRQDDLLMDDLSRPDDLQQ